MTNFADTMALIDAALDQSIISDDLVLPDGTVVRGRLIRGEVPLGFDDGGELVGASEIRFECAYSDDVAALKSGEWCLHNGNRYVFRSREPDRGDALGRVSLNLQDAA